MKLIPALFLALGLVSCNDNSYNETNIRFFERISEIKFPKDLKVFETHDNAEFLCCGAFALSKNNLNYFKNNAVFSAIKEQDLKGYSAYSFPNGFFKDSADFFTPSSTMLIWERCNHCTDIKIVIDTLSLKMWCSALYPDQSGDLCCSDTLQK